MTQYNNLNEKLSNLQIEKLKSAIRNKTEVVLILSSKMTGDDETNFSHKFLLTNRQILNLWKTIADKSSIDIKFSKAHISRTKQSGGYLARLPGQILKTGLLPIKNVIKPLAKIVLIPSRLTGVASTSDAGIS